MVTEPLTATQSPRATTRGSKDCLRRSLDAVAFAMCPPQHRACRERPHETAAKSGAPAWPGQFRAWPGQHEGEEHHARSATIAASTTRMPTRNVPKLRHADVSELPFLRSHSRQMAQVFTPPSVSVQQLPHTERRHEAQGPAASREQNAQRSGPSSPECWS